jgi:hypothetical protein
MTPSQLGAGMAIEVRQRKAQVRTSDRHSMPAATDGVPRAAAPLAGLFFTEALDSAFFEA